MALGDNYVTLAEVKRHGGVDDAITDTEITAVVGAVSRMVERYTGRQFNDAGSATAREYHALDSTSVIVDDFHTTTGLIVKSDTGNNGTYSTTITSANYTLEPLNGVQYGQTGWPYRIIRLHDGKTFRAADRPSVQVTAQWGWAAVPADVKQACLIQCARIFRRKYNPDGLSIGVTNDFVLRTPAKLDGDVEAMLAAFRIHAQVA